MAVGEWDQRQLCPDGGCVGVIGPDGTCKVCGRAAANWGDERNRGLNPADDEPEDAEDDDEDDLEDGELAEGDGDEGDDEYDDGEDEDGEDDEDDDDELDEADDVPGRIAAAAPAEWGERELCTDGSCIGVIGDDGRCKVCGKAAKGAVARLAVVVETADAVQTADAVVQTTDATIHTDAPAEPATGDADRMPEPTDDPDSKARG